MRARRKSFTLFRARQTNRSRIAICCTFAVLILLVYSLGSISVGGETMQGPDLDYSKFLHSSQRHNALACNGCHERVDNSSMPRFPGHKACTSCHLGQFTTPAVPMCMICHTDTSGGKP